MSDLDMTAIGEAAATFMDGLTETAPKGAKIGIVGIVAEVQLEDGGRGLASHCSDPRPWVQSGFFQAASNLALQRGEYEPGADE